MSTCPICGETIKLGLLPARECPLCASPLRVYGPHETAARRQLVRRALERHAAWALRHLDAVRDALVRMG